MENTVRLTWAIPVDAFLLYARLEAYAESKATISAFRLCLQYGRTSGAPVSKLPAELIDEVVGYISLSFFEKPRTYSVDEIRVDEYSEVRGLDSTNDGGKVLIERI